MNYKVEDYKIKVIPNETVISLIWQHKQGKLEPLPTLKEKIIMYLTGEDKK